VKIEADGEHAQKVHTDDHDIQKLQTNPFSTHPIWIESPPVRRINPLCSN
jgi:hypothetical protein